MILSGPQASEMLFKNKDNGFVMCFLTYCSCLLFSRPVQSVSKRHRLLAPGDGAEKSVRQKHVVCSLFSVGLFK